MVDSDSEADWGNDAAAIGEVIADEAVENGSQLNTPMQSQFNSSSGKSDDSGSEWEEDFAGGDLKENDDEYGQEDRRKAYGRTRSMPTSHAVSMAGLDIAQDLLPADGHSHRRRRHDRRPKLRRSRSHSDDSWDDINVLTKDAHNAGDSNRFYQDKRKSRLPRTSVSSLSDSDDDWDDTVPIEDATNFGHDERRHRDKSNSSRQYRQSKSGRRSGSRDKRSKPSRRKSSERHRDMSLDSGTRRRSKEHVRFSAIVPSDKHETSIEQQVGMDESERLALYLNKAAKRIQIQFRLILKKREDLSDADSETESFEEPTAQETQDVEEQDIEHTITMASILIFSVAMMSKRWIIKCFEGCRGNQKRSGRRQNNRDHDGHDDPEMVNPDEIPVDGNPNIHGQGQGQGQGQTGPTGPSAPPGMESMASQAASSAAGGAASGASAGIAAGAAAASAAATSAAATSAMAAAGVAAGATQLAMVAIVGTTVVVASSIAASAGFSETVIATPRIPFQIVSTCGIESPVFHNGTIDLSFEGFERGFNAREQQLVETLVVDSYNLITRGTNQEVAGCADAYQREMQNSTMLDQVFNAGKDEDPSTLDVTFDSWVICNGCPDGLPMIGRYATDNGPSISRRLQSVEEVEVDLGLLDQLLKDVARKIVELADSGELAESFIPSKIGIKGQPLSSFIDSEGKDSTPMMLLNLPIGYEDPTSTNGREVIFPRTSACGSSNPEFYPGIWRISLQGVSRVIATGEIGVIEELMLGTFNYVAVGSTAQPHCDDSEFTYDFGMMEVALREIIARMVGLVNNDTLSASLLPNKVSILPPTQAGSNGNGGGQGTALEPLLNVPIIIETDENGDLLANVPKPSACGLLDPSFYPGELRMTFEGFERVFTEEEAALIEPIVLSSYNALTKGPTTEEGVCVDEYKREMTNADLADQTFSVPPGGDEVSVLDLVIETWVTCDGCSEEEAVFGSSGSFQRRTQDGVGGDGLDLDFVEIHMEEVVAGIFELVRIGALPAIFIPEKVYVKSRGPNGESGAVLLDVPILVNYREQTGYSVQFPGPSQAPSMSILPSSMPSDVPSLSMVPSEVPSDVPSVSPSAVPSDMPSVIPSDSPSSWPSVDDSVNHSERLAFKCTIRDPISAIPSMTPSMNPSEMPSTAYQGCFVEKISHSHPKMELLLGATGSVDSCITQCGNFGYIYAGLSTDTGTICYCGDSYDVADQVDDLECDNDYGGSCGAVDCGGLCGPVAAGFGRTSVYMAGEPPAEGNLTFQAGTSLSVKGCIALCGFNGYDYAALNNGSDCYCGDDINADPNPNECGIPCTYQTVAGCNEIDGSSSCTCGGAVSSSVYRTKGGLGCW
ncbi:unnamed protein product [Cylindrotheca closterium]|uniref:WSC domain-containing protein n=1 Tax=Cylindrotheca closterium TaxID=2856 RepID=A0AAD2FMS5_9STRA|nr:unnamed protein product [Cylindrotheca closterium]